MTAAAIAKPAQIMMLARSTWFGPVLEPHKVAPHPPESSSFGGTADSPAQSARLLGLSPWWPAVQESPRTIF